MESKIRLLLNEINKSVIGKEDVVKKSTAVLLAGGHLLFEDIPGVGKTTISKAIATASGLETTRIQFTPDTLPSDITGFTIWDAEQKKFRFHKGAVMTNILLADEINRTSPRTQSALLQAMEESCVTVEDVTLPLEKPFMVIATQNPLGSAGTMPLPLSQLDRFMVRLSLGRPDKETLARLLTERSVSENAQISQILSKSELLEMQSLVQKITFSPKLAEWVAELIERTHEHAEIVQGASPRAALSLMKVAKSAAFMDGRDYVLPTDIAEFFCACTAHRLVVQAGSNADVICNEIIKISVPPHLKR